MELKNKKIKSLFEELEESDIQEIFNKSEKDEFVKSTPLLNFVYKDSGALTMYIKFDDHYLKVFTSDGKNHMVCGKLIQIKEKLPSILFSAIAIILLMPIL